MIFGMVSELDEVADRLAQLPLALRPRINRVLVRAEGRGGPVGLMAGLAGGVAMAVSTVRRVRRMPDEVSTRRLYEHGAGVDRDRAIADLAFLADRLSPLALAPDGRAGDARVRAASRRLVRWVAAGRPRDDEVSSIETAFAHYVQTAEDDEASGEAKQAGLEPYVDAWDTVLRGEVAS